MRALVTGSTGHLGEGLVRTLRGAGVETIGLDIRPSPFTTHRLSITARPELRDVMSGVDTVFHTATLHKPHVVTHSMQAFVETNISGTLALLETAVEAGVAAFVLTSTTSVFGDALRPPPGAPAVWVTETLAPRPRNIYGVTKLAAEELCRLIHRTRGLSCVVLRTSRFFPEEDDDRTKRNAFSDRNLKANEFLNRRVDLEDVASAHLAAASAAGRLGFGRYIISATTPFQPDDVALLRREAPGVVVRRCPRYREIYARLGWRMFDGIDRVYVNDAARRDLGWRPRYDFDHVLDALDRGEDFRSPLSRTVGVKGYHAVTFEDGPYPVDEPS